MGGAGVGWTKVPLANVSPSPGTTVVDTLTLPSGTMKSGGWLVVAVALADGASSKAGSAPSGGEVAGGGLTVAPEVEALATVVVVVVVVVAVVVEASGTLSGAFTSVELTAGSVTVGSVEEETVVVSVVEFPTACGAEDSVVADVVFSAFEFTGASTAEDSVEELTVVVATVELTSVSILLVVMFVFCASGTAVVVPSWLILAS